ncbi:unnamed protein product [Boreogadus saida]
MAGSSSAPKMGDQARDSYCGRPNKGFPSSPVQAAEVFTINTPMRGAKDDYSRGAPRRLGQPCDGTGPSVDESGGRAEETRGGRPEETPTATEMERVGHTPPTPPPRERTGINNLAIDTPAAIHLGGRAQQTGGAVN